MFTARRLVSLVVFVTAAAAQAVRGVQIETSPAAAGPGRRYALLIGIDAYRTLPALKTALADARAVASTLRSQYGFQTEVLANARRDDILSALNRYRRRLSPEDSMLIYYAGHGHFDTTLGKAYWLPVDSASDDNTHWILADDITSNVKAIPARHVLIIADSCYSGTLSRAAPASLQAGSEGDRSRYLASLSKRASRILLASGGNEPVSDGGGDGKHSIFASILLDSLQQRPPGKFTVEELSHSVRERVAGRSNQVPECSPLMASGHDGGSFVFDPSAAPSPEPMRRALELFDSMDERAASEFQKVSGEQPGVLDALAYHALVSCTNSDLRLPLANPAARKEADDVIAQEPENLVALVALASCGGTSRAGSAKLAVSSKPVDARGLLLRGLAYQGLADWPHALEDFTAALRLKSDFVSALVRRGILNLNNLKQTDAAIADFTRALSLKPAYLAYEGRGRAYAGLQQFDKAVQDYTAALGIRPDTASVLANRGKAQFESKSYTPAIADYSDVIRLAPSAVAYHDRGLVYSMAQEYEKSVEDYTQSLRLNARYGPSLAHRADVFMKTKQYDRALADYNEILRLTPNDPVALEGRARAKEATGSSVAAAGSNEMSRALDLFDSMDPAALAAFDKIIQAQPGNLDALAYGALLVCLDSGHRGTAGDPITNAERVLSQQPSNLAALLAVRNCSLGTSKYRPEIEAFNAAVKLKPVGAQECFLHGLAFRALSDWPHAIENFSAAIQMKPDFVYAFEQRGLSYYNQKDYNAAISDFTQALRSRPVYIAFELRGLTYNNLGQNDKALADYSEALRLRPDSANTLINRGRVFFTLSRFENAITDYSAAIRIAPSAFNHNYRGVAYSMLKQFDKAIDDFTDALRLSPKYARALLNRADAYRMSNQFEKAIADFSDAIKLDPRDTEARDSRGVTYSSQGKIEEAFADWAESLRLDPKNSRALGFRAAAYTQKKQYDLAIADYTEMLRIKPDNATALNGRARAREAAGDTAGAQADRDAAKKLVAK